MHHDERVPSLVIQIADLSIDTALDTGFVYATGVSPHLHSHAYYELLASIDGEFALEMLDEVLTIRAGSICLVPPGVYHCTKSISNAPVKLAMRFTMSRAEGGNPSLFDDCERALSGIRFPLIFPDQHELCSSLLTMRRELNSTRWASEVFTELIAKQFFLGALRLICEQDGRIAPAKVTIGMENRHASIEQYIDLHHASPITEDDLAQAMNLSRRQVTRVLREIYGMSFREKLIETRMYRALQLLMQTDHTVESIAFMVGYTSLSGFYTAFKKKFGLPANEYRAKMRG
ncbi:MAG: helix-turn-helix domain-containing protein [Ruminococcaceae bacterium]|nr:helix-turn-helix domain-containing protein [Oscillospiraceae bacterium]